MTTLATPVVPAQRTAPVPPRPATLVRLRPIVHATPVPQGVHVRGWSSSFTVKGGAGLWRLWEILSARLADGLPADQVAAPEGRPEVTRAVSLLLDQLREHDMLVEVPVSWAEQTGPEVPAADVAAWLSAVAADPAQAWRRLRAATVHVAGDGPPADSAVRALTGAGVRAVRAALPGDGRGAADLLLSADAPAAGAPAVAARCRGEVGLVTPVSDLDAVWWQAQAATLRVDGADAPGEVPYALAALVGAAAAHRIVCAVAGLPDPAAEAAELGDGGPGAPAALAHPAVLVARLDPLTVTYHPFLPAAAAAPPPATVEEALQRLDALTDPELGPLPVLELGDLPQTPAALAACGDVAGFGATGDAARLDAVLRHAERLLAAGDAGPVAVGVDERHARGLALRRLADAVVEDLDAVALPETAWSGSPAARRWWKALTLRFGHPAWVHVRQPAPGVVHAEIACGGEVVAWAVEADAGDAVAFAALAAVAAAQARAAGAAVPTGPVTLSGAAPVWRPSDADTVAWSAGWDWPAGAGAAEDGLQQALRSLPQLSRAAVWTVDGAAAEDGLTEQAAQLRRALGAVGFTVVRWAS